MANFGGLTDHFGIATADLILIDSSSVPVEQKREDALDENGDVCDTEFHGNTAGTLLEVSCKYSLKSSTLNLNTLQLGELTAGTIAESIKVNTGNTQWPEIEMSGKMGAETVVAPTGFLNTYTLPSITLTAIKQAQKMGFSTISKGRLTACSLEASIELAQQDDGTGEPVAHGVSGGTGTVTAEFVRVDDAPAWTGFTSGFIEQKKPGLEEGQASFHTSTGALGFTLARDAAP